MAAPTPARYVLFPGRHHLVTRFQVDYLTQLLAGTQPDETGTPVPVTEDGQVIWAVTSATHSGTRRNPLPAHRREALIEAVTSTAGIPSLVAPVADVAPTSRFATTVLGSVALTLDADLHPGNTIVACSTPQVAAQYRDLGFTIAPVEAGHPVVAARPWDVLELLLAGDPTWVDLTTPRAVEYYHRYNLVKYIRGLYEDVTVSDEGDLTNTRDYATYTAALDGASDRKWDQVGSFIQPGRVVDLGCAAGGLLERAARDPRLSESDLYGVDVSRHLIAEAQHRTAQGVFTNPNTFFTQRNLLHAPVFRPGSVNTTTTVALTHEIASYGNGYDDLVLLARRIFDHTAPGGVWVNSDVLGPDNPDQQVDLHLDGGIRRSHSQPVTDLGGAAQSEVTAYLTHLSPAERLVQFTYDFPTLSGAPCHVRWVRTQESGTCVARTSLRTAMEFLYTRDYVGNWLSECHERFCDMTYAQWVQLLQEVGFDVDPVSGPWRNQWLVDNSLSHGARLLVPDTVAALPWPNTHLRIVARRPN